MRTVSVTRRISAPADAVWAIVRTGANMDRWMPAVTFCTIDGDGVGARRVCVIAQHELHESLETVDDGARLFQYRIARQDLLPVHNVIGTIHVCACAAAESEVLWFVNFELLDGSAWESVRTGIVVMYEGGLDGLARLVAERVAIPPA
jgi:uncharacterized protein YndB with AHSA1/START domain